MVELSVWFSFVAFVLVLVFSPGPSVFLAASHGMQHGMRYTIGTIAGDLSANIIQMTLAGFGLNLLLSANPEILDVIKWAGVAYIVFLGVRYWTDSSGRQSDHAQVSGASFRKLYFTGFTVSAANPKAILFFASFFPLFLDKELVIFTQLLVLGTTFIILDGLALSIYAILAEKVNKLYAAKKNVGLQNKIVGSFMILAGILLALK